MPLLKEKSVSGYNTSPFASQYSRGDRNSYGYRRDGASEYGYYSDEPTSKTTFGGTSKSFLAGFKSSVAPQKKVQPETTGKYRSGMKVNHKKFGNGTIIAVKDGGKVIDVAFLGVGIKSLASEYAPIEIID